MFHVSGGCTLIDMELCGGGWVLVPDEEQLCIMFLIGFNIIAYYVLWVVKTN